MCLIRGHAAGVLMLIWLAVILQLQEGVPTCLKNLLDAEIKVSGCVRPRPGSMSDCALSCCYLGVGVDGRHGVHGHQHRHLVQPAHRRHGKRRCALALSPSSALRVFVVFQAPQQVPIACCAGRLFKLDKEVADIETIAKKCHVSRARILCVR